MNLKKDLANVFMSKIINVGVGIILGFIVPMYLSVSEYGSLNIFLLYISYAGIFHLGFVDGLYIKYGGKKLKNLNKELVKYEHNFLILLESILAFIMIIIAIILKSNFIFYFAISILPLNMISFYRYIYEATGEFTYSVRITNIFNVMTLVINLSLIYIIKVSNYLQFIYGYLIVYYIVFIVLEFKYYLNFTKVKKIRNLDEIKINIKVGVFVLLGNLATSFFYTIDRWFVKGIFSIDIFAYYSFAVSMMNVINVFVNSIALTLYSYLVRNNEEKLLKEIKIFLILLSSFAFVGYFILEGIVNVFIPKYNNSLGIVRLLFIGIPFYFVINVLYLNLYKAKKIEKKYFKTVITMVFFSVLANFLAIKIKKSPLSIAIATDISFIIWYFYSMKDFKFLKTSKMELIYLVSSIILFIILSKYIKWYVSIILYLLFIFSISIKFYKKILLKFYKNIIKK